MHKTILLTLALTFGCVTAVETLTVTPVEAAGSKTKKKVTKGRNDYTAEQREKFLAEARKICVKKYGATSRVHHIDYKKKLVWCTEPGW